MNGYSRTPQPEAAQPEALVSTGWLADHLTAPDIRVVDATWHGAAAGRDAAAEYRACHIPGAVFFDIDTIADPDATLPHMLPAPELFSSRVRRLGLGDGVRIVVYDTQGLVSAARVWWMFRVFGHTDIAVLDGGLPKWIAEGRPVEDRDPLPRDRHFTARRNDMLVRDADQIAAIAASGREQIVDARSAGRFEGRDAEPWPGRRSGHIPGSLSLPYTALLHPADKTFLPKTELTARVAAAGIDLARPVVTSCGSGITACALALGLYLLGRTDAAVYDGSWAEWGLPGDRPIALGRGPGATGAA
jgi:thiosulfate/3-mercaptopyruvate sulfurtransferase